MAAPAVYVAETTGVVDTSAGSGNPAGILLEGSLKKRGRDFPHRWRVYWFVLYRESRELRYYSKVVHAKWANVPIMEHGAFKIDKIIDIRPTQKGKYGGTRFDIVYEAYGHSHYSGEYLPEHETKKFRRHDQTLNLQAPDAPSKDLWVGVLTALLQGGHAMDRALRDMKVKRQAHGDDGAADHFDGDGHEHGDGSDYTDDDDDDDAFADDDGYMEDDGRGAGRGGGRDSAGRRR